MMATHHWGAEMSSSSSMDDVERLISEGRRLLRLGEWAPAQQAFQEANRRHETPEAFEGLAAAARWLADERGAFDTATRSYELYRACGDDRGAARAAFMLADDSLEWRGEMAVARAWVRRARRLLAGDEDSEEFGRLMFYEGYLPLMEVNDTAAAVANGRDLAALGVRRGSSELEMMGAALEGLGLVSAGQVAEGMARLDEATLAAIGDELIDPEMRGTTCCFLIDACGRVRDFDRAGQWSSRMEGLCERLNMQPFFSVCRPNFAQVLIWRGMWAGAETQLMSAIQVLEAFRAPMAVEGVVRLAELRCRQGRLDEAAQLFASVASEPLAQLGQAQLALATGGAQRRSTLLTATCAGCRRARGPNVLPASNCSSAPCWLPAISAPPALRPRSSRGWEPCWGRWPLLRPASSRWGASRRRRAISPKPGGSSKMRQTGADGPGARSIAPASGSNSRACSPWRVAHAPGTRRPPRSPSWSPWAPASWWPGARSCWLRWGENRRAS